jgi:hypothetical protein
MDGGGLALPAFSVSRLRAEGYTQLEVGEPGTSLTTIRIGKGANTVYVCNCETIASCDSRV